MNTYEMLIETCDATTSGNLLRILLIVCQDVVDRVFRSIHSLKPLVALCNDRKLRQALAMQVQNILDLLRRIAFLSDHLAGWRQRDMLVEVVVKVG